MAEFVDGLSNGELAARLEQRGSPIEGDVAAFRFHLEDCGYCRALVQEILDRPAPAGYPG